MTIADYLTLGRIIVAPIVFILFLQDNSTAKVVAFVLFSLGAISDTLDGYIARRTKLSDFGKLWDPIADKLLTGLALVALSILGILPWWIAAGLVLRDIVVTAVRIAKIKSEGKIILPVLAAKLKTTLEMILIVGLLLWETFIGKPAPSFLQITVLVWGCVVLVLSWGTGIGYLLKSRRI